MRATDLRAVVSFRHPLGATLLLTAVVGTVVVAKWPSLASYVWQQHHVYLPVAEGRANLQLPPELAASVTAGHERLTAVANDLLGFPVAEADAADLGGARLAEAEPQPSAPPAIAPPTPATPLPAPVDAPEPQVDAPTVAAPVEPTPAPAVEPPPAPTLAPVEPPPVATAIAVKPPVAAPAPQANPAAPQANPPPPQANPAVPQANPAAQQANPTLPAADPASPQVAPPPPAAIEAGKLVLRREDKVLFCGDSLMQGLAPTMAPLLRRSKVAYTDLSKQSTGLAYPSAFDWPKTIRKQIAAGNATVLIVMVGANDAWDIIYKGKVIPFGSPEWRDIYGSRVESIATMAKAAGVRVVWVGLPPMDAKRLTTGAPVLNDVFREVTSRHDNTLFIPAAGAFSDDGATFTRYKTNSAGLVQLLRASDGIHMAPAGNRLLSELVWSHVEVL